MIRAYRQNKTYTPQMFVATTFVVILPMFIVWLLRNVIQSITLLVSLISAIALTLTFSAIGSLYWQSRETSGEILFSELMIWGWIRRLMILRDIDDARNLLIIEGVKNPVERITLMRKLAKSLDDEDPYLHGHSSRVARYAGMTARKLGVDPGYVTIVENAAILHDIGKLNVDGKLIQKPGKLTDEEYAQVKKHPEHSARIIGFDMPDLASIVKHHHERFDGSGYPDGLVGEDIPLGSRIIAVVDTFDAICSTRPYRNAQPHRKALDILVKESGTAFDPVVIRAFLAMYADRGTGAFILSGYTLISSQKAISTIAQATKVTIVAGILGLVNVLAIPILARSHSPPRSPPPKEVIAGTGHPGGGLLWGRLQAVRVSPKVR